MAAASFSSGELALPPRNVDVNSEHDRPLAGELHEHDDHESADNGAHQAEHTRTVFGIPVFLTPIRAYTPPLEIDWAGRSFDMYFGFFFKDSVVADQFRTFYFRTSLSFVMGTAYALAFLVAAVFPILSRKYREVWGAGAAVLTIAMPIDLSLHLFASVTPSVAKARMVASFVIAATPIIVTGWSLFSAHTECNVAIQLPSFRGRLDVSTDEQRRLCVRVFEPYSSVAVMLGTLGVLLYPVAHVVLVILYLVLVLIVGRQIATGEFAHETYSEIAVEAAMAFTVAIGAVGITHVRFSAATAAFKAVIGVELQRQEAVARAAELHQLLHTIVPAAVLPRLEVGGPSQYQIDHVPSASMLFADMKGFTAWSTTRTAAQVTSMLNTVVADLDVVAVNTETVEKIKTVGDAYWAVAGIPVEAENHADQLVLFGWRMNGVIAGLNEKHAEWGGVSWRVGIHTGPMTGALFGDRQVSYEVFGETSRITQLVEANGISGAVVVTEQTLASLLVRPEESMCYPHAELSDCGPNGGVLTMYELPPPDELRVGDTHSLTSRVATVSEQTQTPTASVCSMPVQLSARSSSAASGPSGGLRSPAAQAVVVPLLRGGLLHNNSPQSAPLVSHRSSVTADDSARRRIDVRSALNDGDDSSVKNLSTTRLTVVSHHTTGSTNKQHIHAVFAPKTVEDLEKVKWRLLPYFENDETEVLFKSRAEVVCRNMNRVCSTLLIIVHGIHMLTLVALPDRCFQPIGVSMQALAIVPFLISAVCAHHPTWSLRVATIALSVAATVGIVGTGLTPLNGCVVGHDIQTYTYIAYACIFFSAGPVSWPVLFAFCATCLLIPATILTAFFSPIAVVGIAMVPMGCMICALIGFTEERLVRRRFIEEEIARRGNAELAELGEQRVAVLQRLVPEHVVSDLIEWFGTKMDPDKSITRSYDRVVVAFMQLRPTQLNDLPVLHAEVDAELSRICKHDLFDDTDATEGDEPSEAFPNRALRLSMPRGSPRVSAMAAIASPRAAHSSSLSSSVLDKIKTVGDLVMIAGPFPHCLNRDGGRVTAQEDTNDKENAPHALPPQGSSRRYNASGHPNPSPVSIDTSDAEIAASFSAVLELFTRVRPKCPVQIGAHVGPVVGTVQGSSRLAFDVFGDAVNVASRVLSCAKTNGSAVHVSGALADTVVAHKDIVAANVAFGPPVTITAKGKGSITVHPVDF